MSDPGWPWLRLLGAKWGSRLPTMLGLLDRIEQAESLAVRLATHKQAYEKLQQGYRAASLQVGTSAVHSSSCYWSVQMSDMKI
jgi:hypothetical protein